MGTEKHSVQAAPNSVRLAVRVLKSGPAHGPLLVSAVPLSFYGGIDLERAVVVEAGHPLKGRCIRNTILCFPTGKGSTVGAYALYRLARNGLAPAALVMHHAEPIVVSGAILADIPCVDGVDPKTLAPYTRARLENAVLVVETDDAERPNPETRDAQTGAVEARDAESRSSEARCSETRSADS